jgi:hypothetical protein
VSWSYWLRAVLFKFLHRHARRLLQSPLPPGKHTFDAWRDNIIRSLLACRDRRTLFPISLLPAPYSVEAHTHSSEMRVINRISQQVIQSNLDPPV